MGKKEVEMIENMIEPIEPDKCKKGEKEVEMIEPDSRTNRQFLYEVHLLISFCSVLHPLLLSF
jgi:hypothetical protein